MLLNEAMASCQSVTYVKNELIGDPLEIKMLEDTEYVLHEQNTVSNSPVRGDDIVLAEVCPKGKDTFNSGLAIIKRFDFESKLQRMSVVVKNKSNAQYKAYVKGSPEKVAELCIKSSLPLDYDEILEAYTNKGYRVIALATKALNDFKFLQVQQTNREKIERNLHFLGFLIMENKLKDATRPTIDTLNQCRIRTIMATGDNTLTAISVARECNILKSDQEVYFGDVENSQIVWKLASRLGDADFEQEAPNSPIPGNEEVQNLIINPSYQNRQAQNSNSNGGLRCSANSPRSVYSSTSLPQPCSTSPTELPWAS